MTPDGGAQCERESGGQGNVDGHPAADIRISQHSKLEGVVNSPGKKEQRRRGQIPLPTAGGDEADETRRGDGQSHAEAGESAQTVSQESDEQRARHVRHRRARQGDGQMAAVNALGMAQSLGERPDGGHADEVDQNAGECDARQPGHGACRQNLASRQALAQRSDAARQPKCRQRDGGNQNEQPGPSSLDHDSRDESHAERSHQSLARNVERQRSCGSVTPAHGRIANGGDDSLPEAG